MQIVIDIPNGIYDTIQAYEMISREQLAVLQMHILNGTPLPKGHGRLIDADYLKDVILLHNFHGNNKNIVPYTDRKGYRLRQKEVDESIINAPTIIEADKEYEAEVITRGKCMMCGKELTEGLFFCKECGDKANSGK